MPLSSGGLWLAEIMTPPNISGEFAVRYATAGVGQSPICQTSQPAAVKPAEIADDSISPDDRESCPIAIT